MCVNWQNGYRESIFSKTSGLKYFSLHWRPTPARTLLTTIRCFLAPIVIVDSLLDYLSAAIRAIRLTVHDRPPLVLGSVHFGVIMHLQSPHVTSQAQTPMGTVRLAHIFRTPVCGRNRLSGHE